MSFVLDTSAVIPLRDGHQPFRAKLSALAPPILMSMVTRVELESGVYRTLADVAMRRRRVDSILSAIIAVPFENPDAAAYGQIVAQAGYSRRKLLDRMIAAQALVRRATLVTLNPADFADVPGLQLLAW